MPNYRLIRVADGCQIQHPIPANQKLIVPLQSTDLRDRDLHVPAQVLAEEPLELRHGERGSGKHPAPR